MSESEPPAADLPASDLPELVELRPSDWSSITYRMHSCPAPSDPDASRDWLRSHILVISFDGECGIGCEATPDCLFMSAAIGSAMTLCNPAALVLDMTNLTYEWGDYMAGVLYSNFSPRTGSELPFAVVASDRCRPALTTLLDQEMDVDPAELLVDDLETAIRKVDAAIAAEIAKHGS